MLIGIDGNEANIEKRVGVNVYAFELLWALYKLRTSWNQTHRLIVYLRNDPLNDMPPADEFFSYRVIPGEGKWIISKLMPDLFKNPHFCEVFFSPSHYIPPFAPMPRICSIMDLGYLESSEQFTKKDFWQLKLWTAYSLYISKKIIAISKATKRDIVRHYPAVAKKIDITYLAYDSSKFNTNIAQQDVRRIKKKYSIVSDYILFLSTLKPSKNVEGLLEAWKIVTHKMPATTLVIAGKKGWLYDNIFAKATSLNLQNSVVFTDFVDEKDKPALVAGAKAFVLPSFWEGFGLDPLNAMACGVPVIVSNRGSLPEVVSGAGILIDPQDPNTIGQAILDVLTLPKSRYNKLAKAGVTQAAKFSWEKTALKTLKIIESIK